MSLSANFIEDTAAHCANLLAAAGYAVPAGDAESHIRLYVSVKHRRADTRPRRVHKAPYTVPAELQQGEQEFLAKVEAGDNIWPHQSRKITKTKAEDGMLNDFGIQHFHLGTEPDPKHIGLVKGGEYVLFGVVRPNDFYAIGIYGHEWTRREVLEEVRKHFPHLLEPYIIKGPPDGSGISLARKISDEEYATLREKNVNTAYEGDDGTVYMGMGGGISSSGNSFQVTRDTDKLIIHLEDMQNDLIQQLGPKIEAKGMPDSTVLKLQWRGNKPFVVTDPPGIEASLEKWLVIPPL
mgnify:CR=1 FL=1